MAGVNAKSGLVAKNAKEAETHLEACREGHERRRYKRAKLPNRVIDVGLPDRSRDPFLFESRNRGDQLEPTETSDGVEISVRRGSDEQISSSGSDANLDAGDQYRYTTLSYSWGRSQVFVTLERLKEGISWRELPFIIQDEILVTRGFGIRYILVDAICII